ncbi:hypothetical protein [Microvirga terricola]|uniref:Uncharacterized protein n=1 Tax=Microvirga terricola TaxID=2719797 RepID=A0ABX0VDE1_9HYPH|nr:hypothetical protein [Microvirga terricola]NIX77471.1 hypothetical protein [Microvirga terricola]
MSWFYRSKELYLFACALQMILLASSIIAPFFTSTPLKGLAAFFGISGGGTFVLYAVEFLL